MTKRFTKEQQREKARLRTRAWHQKFRTKAPKLYRAWRRACKERQVKAGNWGSEKMMLRNALARAKRHGLPFEISLEDIVVPEYCPVLGIKLSTNWGGRFTSNSPSLDRIKPSLGYIPGNVIVISCRANTLKRDATPKELRLLAEFYTGLEKRHAKSKTVKATGTEDDI